MTALICFTMDNLGDAADLYRGVIQEPRKPGERPAFEIGYPALLELYKAFDIPITHFVEGWSANEYPDEIRRVLDLGHEVGMHGWQHEKWEELTTSEARELAIRATEAIVKAGGVSPKAFRAPGGYTNPHTASTLVELGYTIDASLSPWGYEGGPVAQVRGPLWKTPYQWVGVDAYHWLWDKRSKEEAEKIWQDALDRADKENSHLIFIWHPHIMGINPGRMAVGKRIAEYVTGQPDRFRVARLSDLVDHYRKTSN